MDYTQWWEPRLYWFWIVLCLFMVMMFVCATPWARRAGACRWRTRRGNPRMPFGCCAQRRDATLQRQSPAATKPAQ